MDGIIGKIARFAASKAAAFSYAVAVGVAANVAFHFVQPHEPAPALTMPASIEARPAENRIPAAPAGVTTIVPRPAPETVVAPAPAPVSTPNSTHPSPPVAPPRPAAAAKPVATAPVLPPPPATAALPGPDSLRAPALKPAVLPSPSPSEAALRPIPAPVAAPVDEAAPAAHSAAAPAAAALPPLSPAIEVATPPMPPVHVTAPPLPAAATAAASRDAPNGLEISDIWHPGRAVQKGLHWAGKQVPLIGDADAKPHEAAAASSAPIPLLPSAAESAALEKGDAAPSPKKPTAPGPGSGGLY